MKILKSKKESRAEINPYAGEQSTSNQTVINIDKWVDQAKANKAMYESIKSPLEDVQKELLEYRTEIVNKFCEEYPVNLARYNYPHLIKENPLDWNKEALLTLFSDMSGYGGGNCMEYITFIKFMKDELAEFIGIGKDVHEQLMIQNGWGSSEIDEYILSKFHKGDY